MRRVFTFLFFVTVAVSSKAQLVISQIYGAGGNAGASYLNDYVEIFNPTGSSVTATNWSVQYAAAAGTTWSVATFSGTIPSGGYFLIQLASGGAVGAALPTPDASATGINISASAGKLALVNNNTALSGSCPGGVVDLVGYGGTATCFETAQAPTFGGNTNAIFRASNGCTDNNNNSADFSAAAAAPRNSATIPNPCTSAALSVNPPTLSGFSTTLGVASTSQSFILTGNFLTGFPSNITVTAPANYEVSLDNSSFSASVLVPYASATLSATTIYVRISAAAVQGTVSGNVTNAGGGATTQNVSVTGNVNSNFYSKSTGSLDVLATWGTNTDGSGAAPANFTSNNITFNVRNNATPTIAAAWTVSGTNSRVIVGDGISACNLTIPSTFAFTGTVDVSSQGTLTLQNATIPTLGTLSNNSTVDYAQTSAVVATAGGVSYYHLKFTNGTKTFASGIATIRGDWTVNATTGINGSATPFTTVNLYGNATFSGASTFVASPGGDANRLTLNMEGTGTQTITGNGTDVLLFRLGRSAAAAATGNLVINLATGTNVQVGNATGGGLQLTQAAATTTQLNLGSSSNTLTIYNAGVITNTVSAVNTGNIASTNGSIVIFRVNGVATEGTLRFAPSATLTNLSVDMSGLPTDSVVIENNVTITGNLAFPGTAGVIFCATSPAGSISMTSTSAVTGTPGANAYVNGPISKTGSTVFTFPLGENRKYAPATVKPASSTTFTAQYWFRIPPANFIVDPTTPAPLLPYIISNIEYWNITRSPAVNADSIVLYWNDGQSGITSVPNTRMGHYDGTDWDDPGSSTTIAQYGTTTVGSVRVTNLTQFGLFTLTQVGVGLLPIKLLSFNGKAFSNTSAQLNWVASCSEVGSYFELQRSTDAINFTSVVNVSTNGICTNRPFSYTDNAASPGKNYYRLKLVNHSGIIEYSNIVLINTGKSVEVSILQNPVAEVLTVNLGAISSKGTMRIVDMNGRVISSQSFDAGDQNISINTRQLTPGNYFLQVHTDDGIVNKRFIKM